MPGFGETLRSEREARNVPIERIASETGIHPDYLEALEKDEFQDLPGRSFGKLYIRAYARMLGLDPQPLIEAYDREWQRPRPAPSAPSAAPTAGSRPVGSLVTNWRQSRIAERRRSSGNAGDGADAAGATDSVDVDPSIRGGTTIEPDTGEDAVAALDSAPTAADEAGSHHETSAGQDDRGHGDDQRPLREPDAAAVTGIPRMRILAAVLALSALAGLSALALLWLGRRTVGGAERLSSASTEARSSPDMDAPPASVPAGPSARGAAPPPSPKRDVPASGEIRSSSEPRPGSVPPASGAGRTNTQSAATLAAPSTGSIPNTHTSTDGASISVTESALGRRIVGHRIVGRDERFKEGTVVWFQTRAVGGASGDAIRHVWSREGKPVQTIRLPLGGPDWRTVSRKTLTHAGSWAVEARDQNDRVLARVEFACEPSSY